ncbi:MAG: hypothetical protein HZR80_18655 [Candidatus Heimdallarchaeota archaeon]
MDNLSNFIDEKIGKMTNVGFEAFHWHLSNFPENNPEMKRLMLSKGIVGGSVKRFQNFLLDNEKKSFIKEYYTEIIQHLSIWLEPEFYINLPIILPYSVRERTSSYDRLKKDKKDNWGSANKNGYVIDDNTDIKDFIRRSEVRNSKYYYKNKPYTGFIACHIWANTTENPKLFSFIPNLVWLPTPIAGLSDKTNSLFSNLLKEISIKMYFRCKMKSEGLRKISYKIWKLLDVDFLTKLNLEKIEITKLPFSKVSLKETILTVIKNIEKIQYFISKIKSGVITEVPLNEKLIHKRYLPTLIDVINSDSSSTNEYQMWLSEYSQAIKESFSFQTQQKLV